MFDAQAQAAPNQTPRARAEQPSTWWFVVTHSGTQMLALRPDSYEAPVTVWENGYLVRVKFLERCTPAQRPDVRREVVPDFSAANAACPVPARHPVWEMRFRRNAPAN
ncbi:hypothetical protein [Streptomyces rubradiris]|uniref:hypothetical protein n=1 Tax=Streptomyces rubradiris TaxID=285531 RepID=UPI001673D469|nr:hypothetical protein [Streptomyces rubradiris]GHH31660.1 hypothetical protein GCM10018792_79470 [Streptomyces rubradiris]